MKKYSVTAVLLLVLFLIAGTSISSAQLKQKEAAPDFTLISTEGDSVTLSEQQGKVVILHFWKNN